MAEIKTIEGVECWVDSEGNLVPRKNIKPHDIREDEIMDEIITDVLRHRAGLIRLKDRVYELVSAHFNNRREKYGLERQKKMDRGTLYSFNKRYKLEIKVQKFIRFDDGLKLAKEMIDQCLHRWSSGSNPNLVLVINQAFETDSEGKVSVPRIMGLTRLEIQDDQWQRAMGVIKESMIQTHSKSYVRVYQRVGTENKYEQISLDFANL